MKSENFLLAFAITAAVVSLVVFGYSYSNLGDLVLKISGYATGTGTANLTVETQAAVNFTTNIVNFGSGRVSEGFTSASLITVGSGTVSGGNWTAASGLILENIGNTNVSLNITVGKNASNFIGGTNPVYEINVSNVETGSCTNATFALGIFYNANTSNNILNCNVFRFDSAADSLRIDFNLTIPENSLKGSLGDIITATATAL